MTHEVAPDGSPVAVYLSLPPGEAAEVIVAAVRRGATILELGSGPGRLTHPLVGLGHRVTAVDDSPEMLTHIEGAEAVLADVFTLDLGRTFDAVVAASHFINHPDPARRRSLLDVCRRHVAAGGAVLLERYDPEWSAQPADAEAQVGGMHIATEIVGRTGAGWSAQVTYALDGHRWVQDFTFVHVSEEMLQAEAAGSSLRFEGWRDERRRWALLAPV